MLVAQESGQVTSTTTQSMQQEVHRQSLLTFKMKLESAASNVSMTCQLYNDKMIILEDRLKNLEELLASHASLSVAMRRKNQTASVYEPVIQKLRESVVSLNEQNNSLTLK